jgi:hypothetical protein
MEKVKYLRARKPENKKRYKHIQDWNENRLKASPDIFDL